MNVNAQPLSLTDRQYKLIETAARAVPVRKRDEFLRNVSKHLSAEPSDAAVSAVVNAMLDRITSHHFLFDSKFGKETNK